MVCEEKGILEDVQKNRLTRGQFNCEWTRLCTLHEADQRQPRIPSLEFNLSLFRDKVTRLLRQLLSDVLSEMTLKLIGQVIQFRFQFRRDLRLINSTWRRILNQKYG